MKSRRAFSLLTGVALLGAIAQFDGTPLRAQAPERGDAAGTTGAEPPFANPLWGLPLRQLAVTRERPLFSPSRRPPPPPAPVVAPVAVRPPVKPPQPERPTVALVGTIVGTSGTSRGIFVDTSSHDVLRLGVGEDYHGWVVRLIGLREATLVKTGEGAMVLEMPLPGTVPSKRNSRDAMLDRVWSVGAD